MYIALRIFLPLPQPLCDNHDDGETQALILCDHCGNLCGECDRVLHYSKTHQRQASPSWLTTLWLLSTTRH